MNSSLKPVLFIGLVAAQIAALGWMVFDRNQLVESGTKIRLECEPVDPRSLLSGDYVNLNYKISQFEKQELDELVEGEKNFKRSAPVWVVLKKDDESGFYEAVRISSLERDPQKEGEIVLRGRVASYYPGGSLRILYGLEQYFVPQYEGEELESQVSDTSVEVAVNAEGDSAVTRIFIAGEEVTFH